MLKGRVAIVTGGGSGIGRSIATLFASRGARVCVADLDGEGAAVVADEIVASAGEALAVRTDVADAESVAAMVEAVASRWGELHALVNCAGIDLPAPLEALEEGAYDRVLDVDLKAVYLVTRRAQALLSADGGGAVVNISSIMAWHTAPGYIAYTAAKAGVLGMTRAMAAELGVQGIRVNAICPGFIDTTIWQRNLDAMPPGEAANYAERIRALHPVGRRGLPDDVARATAFLCSDEAAFVSGACLVVDGGLSTQLPTG